MASHCPSGQHHRDAPELHLHSRELLGSKADLIGSPQCTRSPFRPHPPPITAHCLLSNPLEHLPLPPCVPMDAPTSFLFPWNTPFSYLNTRFPAPLHGPAQVPRSLLMKHPQEMNPSSTRLYVIFSPVNLAGGPAGPALGSASAAESPALRESCMG